MHLMFSHMILRKCLLLLILSTFVVTGFVFSDTTLAAEDDKKEAIDIYFPLETIPGVTNKNETTNLPKYLKGLFNFGIAIVGIAALVMITIGGFWYVTSAGNASRTGTAKSMITDAILGLLVALFAWLILYTINPQLVSRGLSGLKLSPVEPPAEATTEQITSANTQHCDANGTCFDDPNDCKAASCKPTVQDDANVSQDDRNDFDAHNAVLRTLQTGDIDGFSGITLNEPHPAISLADLGSSAVQNLPSLPLFCECYITITNATETYGPDESSVSILATPEFGAYIVQNQASVVELPGGNYQYTLPPGNPLFGAEVIFDRTPGVLRWHITWN
jgi:hypothetical protein